MITDARANAMLDTELATNDKCSLHSAYSATGANEIASGGYARQTITWASAASRSKSSSGTLSFTVANGDSVAWVGVWDSAGTTFRGMVPNGGAEKSYQVDVANNRIYCEAHGLVDGDRVTFPISAATGLTAGTHYYVVGTTAGDPDYFQVSTTLGGAAVDITGQPGANGVFGKIVIDAYAGTSTHQITGLTFSI